MDSEFTKAQEQLQERFDDLPQEIMDVIVGGTLDAVVFGIVEEFSLNEEQTTALENEIILVLTFLIERSSFVDNVAESLSVERRIAEAIGVEVQTEIFDLLEEYFEVIEGEQLKSAGGEAQKAIMEKNDQKTDLQRLAEQFAEKSRLAQTTVTYQIQPALQTTPQTNQEVITPKPEEDTLENVQPLRTMKDDINRIHGYGAYNEALEKEGKVHTSSQDGTLGK